MLGVDRFIQSSNAIKKSRAALLTNHATLTSSGLPVALELKRSGMNLIKLFSPEHGIHSQDEDGKAQSNQTDPITGLPVISLYGSTMIPQENDLADIDYVLIDLPSIGCRFYTYLWSISYMMEAAGRANKKVILLDRPNLSQRLITQCEGPLLDESACASFIGRWRMPITFPFSSGELMRWFIYERNMDVELEVVSHQSNSINNFVPPSPAMSDYQTILIYPFSGLLEGINVSHGRGTSYPFRVVGAPWIDAISFHEEFNRQNFSGIKAVPHFFQPMWSRYEKVFCHGLYFTVTDATLFRPVALAYWVMRYLATNYPQQLQPATYPTAANPTGKRHLDLLTGLPDSFSILCNPSITSSEIEKLSDCQVWLEKVNHFLLDKS
ncbi:MAG: DUF1343 domain-containing protein [Cyclobacteriaceae bacterium]|nr:DUF1343 domain-containing protein [Cyclobacteriaceae bacterium]